MDKNVKLQRSLERLFSRDDIRITREQVNDYLQSGKWSEKTFIDIIEQHVKNDPNGIAIIDENGDRVTYKELDEKTDQIALALLELGLQPEDRIAVQLPNCSQFVLTFIGAAKARIVPVFCHMPYSGQDLDYVMHLTKPKAVVTLDTFKNQNYLETMKKLKEKHSTINHIIVVSTQKHEGTENFYHILNKEIQYANYELANVRPIGTDPFFIIFTSGTTGKPKASFHLHANNIYYVARLNAALDTGEKRNVLITPPVAHLTGMGLGVLTSLYSGGTMTFLSSWDVNKAAELIEQEKISNFLGATPMLIDLARSGVLKTKNIRSLKNILYAGSPCPSEILNVFYREVGCDIMAFYGYSEAGLVHCTRPGDDITITSKSFGRVADGVEAKVVDEAGNELQGPCEGEVLARGANFIPGYYRQPENNKKMFDDEGWFHSSDIVRMDENGYCTFLYRKDDLINRGGYKIDPREIEEILFTHPLINQIAVVAMPDERLGERIAAFIIPKNAEKEITLKDITDFLDEKGISKRQWPEAIKIMESFPMTSSGKMQRFAMREMAKSLTIATAT